MFLIFFSALVRTFQREKTWFFSFVWDETLQITYHKPLNESLRNKFNTICATIVPTHVHIRKRYFIIFWETPRCCDVKVMKKKIFSAHFKNERSLCRNDFECSEIVFLSISHSYSKYVRPLSFCEEKSCVRLFNEISSMFLIFEYYVAKFSSWNKTFSNNRENTRHTASVNFRRVHTITMF